MNSAEIIQIEKHLHHRKNAIKIERRIKQTCLKNVTTVFCFRAFCYETKSARFVCFQRTQSNQLRVARKRIKLGIKK